MIPTILTRLSILIGGFLYPAYKSHKAIAKKDTREYVKWMMYWVVFAVFTILEFLIDTFYEEIKVAFVFWLASPSFRGASFVYRRALHPFLTSRAEDIDKMAEEVKSKGYGILVSWASTVIQIGTETCIQVATKVYVAILPRILAGQSTIPPSELAGFDAVQQRQQILMFPSDPPSPMQPRLSPSARHQLMIDFHADQVSHYGTLPRGAFDEPDRYRYLYSSQNDLRFGGIPPLLTARDPMYDFERRRNASLQEMEDETPEVEIEERLSADTHSSEETEVVLQKVKIPRRRAKEGRVTPPRRSESTSALCPNPQERRAAKRNRKEQETESTVPTTRARTRKGKKGEEKKE